MVVQETRIYHRFDPTTLCMVVEISIVIDGFAYRSACSYPARTLSLTEVRVILRDMIKEILMNAMNNYTGLQSMHTQAELELIDILCLEVMNAINAQIDAEIIESIRSRSCMNSGLSVDWKEEGF